MNDADQKQHAAVALQCQVWRDGEGAIYLTSDDDRLEAGLILAISQHQHPSAHRKLDALFQGD